MASSVHGLLAEADPEVCKGGSICVLRRCDFKNLLILIVYVIISDVTANTYVRTSTQKYNNQSTIVAH